METFCFSGPVRVKLRGGFDEVRMASPLLINNIQVSRLHGSHFSLVLATLAVTSSRFCIFALIQISTTI